MFDRNPAAGRGVFGAPKTVRWLVLMAGLALIGWSAPVGAVPVPIPQEQEPAPETTVPEAPTPEATSSEPAPSVPEADPTPDEEPDLDNDSIEISIDDDDDRESSRRTRRRGVNKDTQVHFMSDLVIEQHEVAREAVVLMGSLEVKGKVLGDAVSIVGPAHIEGEVTGTVTAVLDSVYLGPDAEVLGDVVSVGGTVEIHPDARILGEVSEIDFGPALHVSQPWYVDPDWGLWNGAPLGLAWSVFWTVFRWVVLILLVSFIFLVGRDAVERTAATISAEAWKAGLLGLATWLLFFPLMVVATIVLVLSIIGIPLLIIVWPLGLFVLMIACLLGYTASAYAIGGWLSRRFGWSLSPYIALLIGVVAIQSLSLVAEVFGSMGGIFWFFAFMFGLAGWAIRFAAWTAGLGAVIMVYAERRRGGGSPEPQGGVDPGGPAAAAGLAASTAPPAAAPATQQPVSPSPPSPPAPPPPTSEASPEGQESPPIAPLDDPHPAEADGSDGGGTGDDESRA